MVSIRRLEIRGKGKYTEITFLYVFRCPCKVYKDIRRLHFRMLSKQVSILFIYGNPVSHIFDTLKNMNLYILRWKQQAYIIPIMKQAGRRTQQECFLTGSLPLHCSLSACLALVSSCLNLVFYIHALSLFVQCKTHNESLSSLVVKFAPTRDLLLMCALLY